VSDTQFKQYLYIQYLSIIWASRSDICTMLYSQRLCHFTAQSIMVGFLMLYRYRKTIERPLKTHDVNVTRFVVVLPFEITCYFILLFSFQEMFGRNQYGCTSCKQWRKQNSGVTSPMTPKGSIIVEWLSTITDFSLVHQNKK